MASEYDADNIIDARMSAQLNHSHTHKKHEEEQQRLMYQRQQQEEEYNRSIASLGQPSSYRMSRQQLVQRRLERRRQERRLRTNNELQSRTAAQSIQQPPPPPPPSATSPISIMKKNSSYQTMPDQQYVHNHQRQPQHASSNYSSDSSGNYISPPILNRKQAFPEEPSPPTQNDYPVFTQNGVVIDRTAFKPTRNRLRLPHESPSDEWSRNGSPVNQSRLQRDQYQQQYQQQPQLYVTDTPSHNSAAYEKPVQMSRSNRQPNWQELDQQRYQLANRQRGHMGQQQNVSYVSDDEDVYNASFNTQTSTPVMKQNRPRSLSGERQLPRRWRHNRASASVGRRGTSQSSVNTPISVEESPQVQYTPRSRMAVTESLGQPEINTPMSAHSSGARSNPLPNDRHGWRRQPNYHHKQQQQQQQQQFPIRTSYDQEGRQQNIVSPTRSERSNYSEGDQDSVSVASIRKSWEGRVEQQRGRAQGFPYNRGNENQYNGWEGRGNRVSPQQRELRREHNKWKRNSSLPPPERRRGRGSRYDPYYDTDGYQSDGGYRSQPERVEVDSNRVTIHDARRRLWDQDERLRAVLPAAGSFDSATEFKHRRTVPSVGIASPGNVSTPSTGSALFKSKFVHAAALATKNRGGVVDRGHQNSYQYEKKVEEESPKGSSQITDSTADTTAPSSNHNSHGENARGSQFKKQSGQPAATMPSIAEAPQQSVADLIARINAVSRDNPAEALARIDSIIKGEVSGEVRPQRQPKAGVSSLFNFDSAGKQTGARKSVSRSSAIRDPPVASNDNTMFAFGVSSYEEDVHDDPSVNESVSSSDTTVSSMTNPTYQSVQEIRFRTSSRKQEREPPSTKVVTTRLKTTEEQTSEDQDEPRSDRSGNEANFAAANLTSFETDANWGATSVPQSDFFNDSGGFRNASNQAIASSQTQSKKSIPSRSQKMIPDRPATPDIMNAVSNAFSDVNISFGDTGATKDLLSKAFSDIDENGEKQGKNTMSNAFSNVDIKMEQKTVSQRRKELELLSKTFAASSEDEDKVDQNTFGWDTKPQRAAPKDKKKAEPTIRLKSNKKLTQKFANLVKAFEK